MITTFVGFLLLPLFIVGMAIVFLIAYAGALIEDFWNVAVKNRTYNPYTQEYEDDE